MLCCRFKKKNNPKKKINKICTCILFLFHVIVNIFFVFLFKLIIIIINDLFFSGSPLLLCGRPLPRGVRDGPVPEPDGPAVPEPLLPGLRQQDDGGDREARLHLPLHRPRRAPHRDHGHDLLNGALLRRQENRPLQSLNQGRVCIKGEPELTDPFNLLINVKLRML